MAVAKVILNGVTQMDLTSDTVGSSTALSGYTGHGANGEAFQGAYAIPSGTISISSNGTYDVASYASANVSVAGGGGGPGVYTATIVSRYRFSNPESDHSSYGNVNYNGTVYYTEGSSFQFNSGDTLTITVYASNGKSYVREDSIGLASGNSEETLTYNYTLPEHDISIYFAWSPNTASGVCNIRTDENIDRANAMTQKNTICIAENSRVTTLGSMLYNAIPVISTASFPNVIDIGTSTFYYCSGLFNLSFPKCSTIGSSAFGNCTNSRFSTISSAVFPSVTTIHTNAFAGCASLRTVEFTNCAVVGNSAFRNCTQLREAIFPNCTTISMSAFYSIVYFSSYYFPICSSIGPGAFAYTSISTFDFPSVRYIGSYAFASCYKLLDVQISTSGFYYISASAFMGCSSLQTVTISGPIKNLSGLVIANGVFANCSSLVSFSLADWSWDNNYSVYTAYTSMFFNCRALPSMVFPWLNNTASYFAQNCVALSFVKFENIAIIGGYCFAGCTSLSTAILSYRSSLTTSSCYISMLAFSGCSNLYSLYLLGDGSKIYALSASTAFSGTPISVSYNDVYGSIFVAESHYASYIASTNWVTYSARFSSLTDAQIQNVLLYGKHDP